MPLSPLPLFPPPMPRNARRSAAARLWCAIEDRLIPALRLSSHERAIYYYLVRRTHLRGAHTIRVSRTTLGRVTGLNVSTARHYLGVLAQKQCIGFVDRGVRGCLVRVRLPDEILRRLTRACPERSRRVAAILHRHSGVAASSPAGKPPEGKRARRHSGVAANSLRHGKDGSLKSPLHSELRDAKGHFRAWPRRHDYKRERLRRYILARERGRCFYCRRRLPAEWTLDHVNPTIRGGPTNDPANLVACCAVCNAEKGVLPAPEFLRSLASRGILSRKQLYSRFKSLRSVRAHSSRRNLTA